MAFARQSFKLRFQKYQSSRLLLLYRRLKGLLSLQRHCKRPKYKGTSSMECREWGSHARGVYPAQYTSRMETVKVKEEVRVDTKIVKE